MLDWQNTGRGSYFSSGLLLIPHTFHEYYNSKEEKDSVCSLEKLNHIELCTECALQPRSVVSPLTDIRTRFPELGSTEIVEIFF